MSACAWIGHNTFASTIFIAISNNFYRLLTQTQQVSDKLDNLRIVALTISDLSDVLCLKHEHDEYKL